MSKNVVCCNKDKEVVCCQGSKVPGKVKCVRPTHAQMLVEHLTEQELIGEHLVLKSGHEKSKQAYIVMLGPDVPKEKGFKVGDRILLQGSYVPVPKFDDRKRDLGLVELVNVKAVLEEE